MNRVRLIVVACLLPGTGFPASPGAAQAPLPRAGDIVLSRGTGLWSDLFARVNRRDRRFSHAGVVVAAGKQVAVVHAAADDDGTRGGVRLDAWESYASGARELALLRLGDRDAAARVAVAALAMHAEAPPFDFEFRLGDAAVYCGELAWRALTVALERDPLPRKPVVAGRPVVLIENFLLDVPELHAVER